MQNITIMSLRLVVKLHLKTADLSHHLIISSKDYRVINVLTCFHSYRQVLTASQLRAIRYWYQDPWEGRLTLTLTMCSIISTKMPNTRWYTEHYVHSHIQLCIQAHDLTSTDVQTAVCDFYRCITKCIDKRSMASPRETQFHSSTNGS